MLRDDISNLYRYLGQPSWQYHDFQTEENFRDRIVRVLSERARIAGKHKVTRTHKSKIVSIVSIGQLPGRKLVAGLAWFASQRLQKRVPVRVVDMIPTRKTQEDAPHQQNNITHVLVDTSSQRARMEALKEEAWFESQIVQDRNEQGLIFVDVPESVLHARHVAMAASDMVITLLPATLSSVRIMEELESELTEAVSSSMEGGIHYLLVESGDASTLSPHLLQELLAHTDLFVPHILHPATLASASQLNAAALDAPGNRELSNICDYVLHGVTQA